MRTEEGEDIILKIHNGIPTQEWPGSSANDYAQFYEVMNLIENHVLLFKVLFCHHSIIANKFEIHTNAMGLFHQI
jgi:hypothetical protein